LTFHSLQLLKLLPGVCLRCLTALVLDAGAFFVAALSLSLRIPQMIDAIFNLRSRLQQIFKVAIE
jgi:hypothetical protein